MKLIKPKQIAYQHGAKVLPFKELCKESQYSLIHYMAVDGEAWTVSDELYESFQKSHELNRNNTYEKGRGLIKEALNTSLPYYIKKYGNRKFGEGRIPTNVAKEECIKRSILSGEGFETFNEYHKWFVEGGVEQHTSKGKWACILSNYNADLEFFEDGWHRFHRYVELKCRYIPCVFFP
jgi:hypothetical protein